MGISTLISRLRAYYTGHGFGVTIRRAGLQVRRALFSNRMVVFYCEVAKQTTAPANIPNFLKVEREGLCRTQLAGPARDDQLLGCHADPPKHQRAIR
jgi:hypothetical protein